jgi:hypothetical protein
MFCAPGHIFGGTGASDPVFMFCASGLVFRRNEGVGFRFHVLRSRSPFPRYRGRRVPFSSFALPDSFFASTAGIESRFHALRARTRFQRYRGRRLPFHCFVLPDSFSEVPRASAPIFMFCAPKLVFDGTEGVVSCFQVLLARTHFRRYRVRPVPFSCFALLDMFSAVPSASGHVFMFCAPRLIFGGPEDDGSRFHVLRAGTSFLRYRGRRVPFSFFACLDSFSAVPRMPGTIFMSCAPGVVSRV